MSKPATETMKPSVGKQRAGPGVRFTNEAKAFRGEVGDTTGAMVWFNRMARLGSTAHLSDDEILFIAGDHLEGKALTWCNVKGSKATTWKQFETLFKRQYFTDQEDLWWEELNKVKQGPDYPTVDDVLLKLQELFELLQNENETF